MRRSGLSRPFSSLCIPYPRRADARIREVEIGSTVETTYIDEPDSYDCSRAVDVIHEARRCIIGIRLTPLTLAGDFSECLVCNVHVEGNTKLSAARLDMTAFRACAY